MKRPFLLASVALLGAITAQGRQLTPAEACQRATEAQATVLRAPGQAAKPVYTASTGDTNQFYVFDSDGHGFSILAADDLLPAVLAYSDSGSFDHANLPDAAKAWLADYQQQINEVIAGNAAALRAPAQKKAVGPLIKTKWDQNAPYNEKCTAAGLQFVTGCVATAMAQVMNYHQWPEHGEGEHSYTINYGSKYGKIEFSEDFSKTYFDWGNMLDTYTSASPQAAKDAVATLMKSCGISVSMVYGNGESNASSIDIVPALINNFNYSKGALPHERQNYTLDEWDDLLYTELAASRPIIYAGQTKAYGTPREQRGHAFIVDGYDNGYYHINWGWGGISDGYYLLNICAPDQQGTGGTAYGYSFSQSAITGIQRPTADDAYISPRIMQCEGMEMYEYFYGGWDRYIAVKMGLYLNTAQPKMAITPALKLTNALGEVQYIDGVEYEFKYGKFLYTFYFVATSLSDGTYTGELTYKYKGKYYDIIPAHDKVHKYEIAVSERRFDFSPIVDKNAVNIGNLSARNSFYSNFTFSIDGSISADKEYHGAVHANLYYPRTNYIICTLDDMMVSMKAGEEAAFNYTTQMPNVPAEDYEIDFTDCFGNVVSPRIAVTAKTASLGVPTVTDFNITRNPAPLDSVIFTFDASLPEGYVFDLPTHVTLYDGNGGYPLEMIDVNNFMVEGGETGSFRVKFNFANGEIGHKYMAYLEYTYGNSTQNELAGPLRFVLGPAYVAVDSIALGEAGLSLAVGETASIRATVYPSDATDRDITWSSSDSSVATVDTYGNVYAMSGGTAEITATTPEGVSASCTVIVKPQPVAQLITWDQEFGEVFEKDEIVLTAASSAGIAVLYEIAEGGEFATLDGSRLTCVAPGTAVIRAYAPGNDEYLPAEPVERTIEILKLNGINDIRAEGITVNTDGRRLNILNKAATATVRVITITGQTVYRGCASTIELPAGGIYVVSCQGTTAKVSVK